MMIVRGSGYTVIREKSNDVSMSQKEVAGVVLERERRQSVMRHAKEPKIIARLQYLTI